MLPVAKCEVVWGILQMLGHWISAICSGSLMCILLSRQWLLLTFHFQRELTINTDITISVVHPDATCPQNISSGVQYDVVNTRTAISNSHCNMLKSSKDARGQERRVSTSRAIFIMRNHLRLLRFMPGQWSCLQMNPNSNIWIQSTWRITASPAKKDTWNCFWHLSWCPCHCFRAQVQYYECSHPTILIKLVKLFLQSSGTGGKLVNGRGKPPSRPPLSLQWGFTPP